MCAARLGRELLRERFDRAGVGSASREQRENVRRVIRGLHHEMHNEPEGSEVVGDTALWLERSRAPDDDGPTRASSAALRAEADGLEV